MGMFCSDVDLEHLDNKDPLNPGTRRRLGVSVALKTRAFYLSSSTFSLLFFSPSVLWKEGKSARNDDRYHRLISK